MRAVHIHIVQNVCSTALRGFLGAGKVAWWHLHGVHRALDSIPTIKPGMWDYMFITPTLCDTGIWDQKEAWRAGLQPFCDLLPVKKKGMSVIFRSFISTGLF